MCEHTAPPDMPWFLAAIIEVSKEKRVRCQRQGCPKTVWKAVHMIVWADGRIECWGGDCFGEHLAKYASPEQLTPRWSSGGGGHKLTDEQRALLVSNREELVKRIEEDWNVEKLRREEQAKTAAELEAKLKAEQDERISQELAQEAMSISARKSGGYRPVSDSARVNPGQRLPEIREPTDPRYIQIREREKEIWTNSGRSFASPYDWRTLVENAILKYLRRYPDARW